MRSDTESERCIDWIARLAHDECLAAVHSVRALQVRHLHAQPQRHPRQRISALHDVGVERCLLLRTVSGDHKILVH